MMSAEDNSDSESDEDYVPNEEHECNDQDAANSSSSESETETNDDKQEKMKKRKSSGKNNFKDDDEAATAPEPPKKSVDEMWNEFLRDTNSNSISNVSGNETKNVSSSNVIVSSEQQSVLEPSRRVVVTETFDFAGEEIKISKEIDVNSVEARKTLEGAQSRSFTSSSKSSTQPSSSSLKRPGGGLSSVLNQIGKKQKIGTLEKSKFDWDNFKKTESLEEELSQHNRGREGFLDKQEFLQRSDYRQFELERDLRLSRRKNV